MLLDRESLLAVQDIKVTKVAVPAWDNAEVFLKRMTAGERDTLEKIANKPEGVDNPRARLVVLCLCDETGKPLFKKDEFALLADKSAAALDFLFTEACKFNAMGEAANTEEVVKNSEAIPGDSSITA